MPFGGYGYSLLGTLGPSGANLTERAIENYMVNQRADLDRQLQERMQRRAIAAQEAAQKRLFGQQLGTAALSAGLGLAGGAALGAMAPVAGTATSTAADVGTQTTIDQAKMAADTALSAPSLQAAQQTIAGNSNLMAAGAPVSGQALGGGIGNGVTSSAYNMNYPSRGQNIMYGALGGAISPFNPAVGRAFMDAPLYNAKIGEIGARIGAIGANEALSYGRLATENALREPRVETEVRHSQYYGALADKAYGDIEAQKAMIPYKQYSDWGLYEQRSSAAGLNREKTATEMALRQPRIESENALGYQREMSGRASEGRNALQGQQYDFNEQMYPARLKNEGLRGGLITAQTGLAQERTRQEALGGGNKLTNPTTLLGQANENLELYQPEQRRALARSAYSRATGQPTPYDSVKEKVMYSLGQGDVDSAEKHIAFYSGDNTDKEFSISEDDAADLRRMVNYWKRRKSESGR